MRTILTVFGAAIMLAIMGCGGSTTSDGEAAAPDSPAAPAATATGDDGPAADPPTVAVNANGWYTAKDPGGRFTIDFPAEPEFVTDGEGDEGYIMFDVTHDGVEYEITCDWKGAAETAAIDKDPYAVFAAYEAVITQSPDATIAAKKKLSYQGHPGLSLQIESTEPGKSESETTRIFLLWQGSAKLYVISNLATSAPDEMHERAKKFHQSLQVLDAN